LWKKYVLSLDLKLDSESQRIIVSGNEIAGVCLLVCLSVSKIIQKRVDGFG